jgi:ribonuclease Z
MDLAGFSVAGIETCIEAPALRLLLDLGRCSKSAVNQPLALLSHGHLDHMGAIAQHAARRALLHLGESVYIVPRAVAPQVEAFFNAAGALDGQTIPRRVVPLAPGESFSLGKGRTVRPFETFHRVPSQGYTVWQERRRLLPEFRQVDSSELGALRRKGVVIEQSFEVPLLSFTGDTRVEVLERHAELQQTETLVIEASFLDGRVSVSDAREMGHIHLDELLERESLLTRGEVVLTHFSARYDADAVRRVLSERVPDSLQARLRLLAHGAARGL